ncbi:aldo/keto reductase, partial [Paenibacillus sepulcri]|nr:aldo/keto reductase [Paenibacillus sepulcri]
IGAWLKASGKRQQIQISTKGAHPDLSTMNISRLSPRDIVSDLDESLAALGVDEIDLYWLHRDERNRPAGEILETLNRLVREGKIRYFGCSNWRSDRIEEANAYAKDKGIQAFFASQIQWSLAEVNEEAIGDRTMVVMDRAELNFHKRSEMALFAFTSQAKGFFPKMAAGGAESLRDSTKQTYYNEINLGRLARALELSGQLSVPVSAIVLAYLISQPFPVIPVIGSHTQTQIEEALQAAEVRLTPQMVKYLEEG